jgi:dCTP diphosphatase
MNIRHIQKKLALFAKERNWESFHNPKNLAMALSVEVSELVEIFQWLDLSTSSQIMQTDKNSHVREEMADIMIYLLRLADVLEVNLQEAIDNKIIKNKKKYPV